MGCRHQNFSFLSRCEFVTHKTPEDECIAMGMQDDLENCVDMLMGVTNPGNNVAERQKNESVVDFR